MSPTLTVRTDDRDISGDTVLFRDDTVLVMSKGESEAVPIDEISGIIAGEPADPGEAAGRGRASA